MKGHDNQPDGCPRCGLKYQCLCNEIPRLDDTLQLSLLMHEQEARRETNTGRWLADIFPGCRIYPWQRRQPDPDFLQVLESQDSLPFLLFPASESFTLPQALTLAEVQCKTPHFIVLDGTWQEARKMERKSDWLKDIPRLQLNPVQYSAYQLRRNQQSGSLCTLEVISELLKQSGKPDSAQALNQFLQRFMARLQADKSGHALKAERSEQRRNKMG